MISLALKLQLLVDGCILLGLLVVLFRLRGFSVRVIVWSTLGWLLSVVGTVAWIAFSSFRDWNANPDCTPCQTLLPPYSNYWYQETFGRFGAFFGVNAAAGLVFGFLFWVFARMTKGSVIDRDDVFLLTLVGMMVGWPNIIVFLAALFILGVLVFLTKRVFRSRIANPRVVITPLIPLAALPILFWGDFLAARIFNLYDIGLVAITLSHP